MGTSERNENPPQRGGGYREGAPRELRAHEGGDYTLLSIYEETLENNVSIFRLAFILSGSPKYGISSYVISVEEPDKMKANLIITLFSSVSS